MKYYIQALKKYATFTGRARRSEYWFFALFNVIFSLVALGIDAALFETIGYGAVYVLFSLSMFLPALSVLVRRLHDTGRSGFWFFIGLIPFVGGIILLIFILQDSQSGENEYGPNPKEIDA